MSDQIQSLGTFTLKCLVCGGTKFSSAPDVKDKPESPVVCSDCGHTTTAEMLIEQNKEAALESAKEKALKLAADIFRDKFK